jgi:small subunit ribosomal protein S15
MYSRKKGRSGSKKPVQKIASWVKFKQGEIEDIVVKLAKKGNQSAEIGLILRDQYGIPSVKISRLKVSRILKEKGLYPKFPEELMNLFRRAVELQSHLKKNKKDYIAQRGLELTESKIRRLVKYYKRKGEVPADWSYDMERVKLMVK